MKKSLLILCMILSGHLGAQMLYRLDTSRMVYQEISSGSDISGPAWDSAQEITLPFAFKYFHQAYNNLFISYDGVYFSDTGMDLFYYGLHDYIAEDMDITKSPITFDISGSPGSRIIKIQYKNIHEANTNSSFQFALNLQIWLYESNSHIEIHFGPSVITDPQYTSYVIGMTDESGDHDYVVDTTAANPVLVVRPTNYNGIASFPVNGQVYTFVPTNGSSIQQVAARPYRFYNSGKGFLIQTKQAAKLEIMDLNGRLVYTDHVDKTGRLSLIEPQLQAGIYVLVINMDGQIFTEKLHLSY